MRPESFESYLKRNYTNKTAKSYQHYIDMFLIQRPNAIKLSYMDIMDYLSEVKTKADNKPNRINVLLASIKVYYNYLIGIGKRTDHPCKSIKLRQKHAPIQLQDLFTPTELETLMSRENRFVNLELRNKVIISLLIYQALTSAEVEQLTTDDIDLDNGTINIKGSKKQAGRVLDLRANQIRLIQSYIETSRANMIKVESNRLMINQRGCPDSVDNIHAIFAPLQNLYPDRRLNPQNIRQSVISNMLNLQKLPLETVQLFAGHKWPSTTEKYRRKDVEEQRALIKMFHPLK